MVPVSVPSRDGQSVREPVVGLIVSIRWLKLPRFELSQTHALLLLMMLLLLLRDGSHKRRTIASQLTHHPKENLQNQPD